MKNLISDIKRTCKVPLKFHWSAIILPLIFIYTLGFKMGIILGLMLFSSLLFHEYAHVFMAIKQGVGAKSVTVFAMGAWALLDPYTFIGKIDKQLKIAIAGPMASFFLGCVSLLLYFIFPNDIVANLFIINIMLCLFNLLPIFPMDGGRVLNSILSERIGLHNGLEVSTIISYILSGIGGLIALYYSLIGLVIMAIVVSFLAYKERQQTLVALEQLGFI